MPKSTADIAALNEKKAELDRHLDELAKEAEQVDLRERNQKAGYVYIISNIGTFGENVYKISMRGQKVKHDKSPTRILQLMRKEK